MRWIQVTILFCLLASVSAYDWNWMDCHNGTYDPTTRVCNCQPGWTGIDCSRCGSDSVCNKGDVCVNSIIVQDYKAFNCTNMKEGLIPAGGLAAQWTFDPNTGAGSGVMNAFLHPMGAPFLFNCTFQECTKNVDYDAGTESAECLHTSCYCSSWCSLILSNIISGMKGSAKFACDLSTSACVFTQVNSPLPIDLQCVASSCEKGPYVPPPPKSPLSLTLIILGSVVGGVIIIGGLVGLFILLRKRAELHFLKQYQEVQYTATISWDQVHCVIDRRQILHDVSGIASPGQITAILGPSGAGKTSFIDIIAGRKNVGTFGGTILVNGTHRTKSWKRLSGYVLQEDKFLGTMTVEEHLMFVAQLRLPSDMPYRLKLERVRNVMEELHISHIAQSRIGTEMARGISGGERRRLSIASELVTDPAIIILDEPTSGLDSYAAFSLMETLKRLALQRHRTIIVSIHQPRSNIFSMFDNVLLLAEGKQVYFGSAMEILPHFAALGHPCPVNYNPADFLIDLVSMSNRDTILKLVSEYPASDQATSTQLNINNSIQQRKPLDESSDAEFNSTWFTQLFQLSKRTLVHNLRNPYLLRTQYVVSLVLAFILGNIFWKVGDDIVGVQDRAGCLFFIIALLSFSSLSSIDTFFQERVLYVRERANGMYRSSTYFFSKALCDLIPMRIIPPLILGGVVYWMVGLRPDFVAYGWFLVTVVLVSIVAGSLSLVISSVTPSLSLGNLVAILMLLFFLLFGGFLVNKQSMPQGVGWLKQLSFFNFAFEVMMVNELYGGQINFNPTGYNIKPVWVDGMVFLKQFDMDPDRFNTDLIVLGAMIVAYLSIAYICLRFFVKEKR
eukprot:TRINITY_DN675_c0_g1_i1.p1 TRINITY_DN675_c0_g1~~TRINITY_DN675_c0_g1_i1.p1  ORF type:complete len:842 (+),score=177.45 TRINITY_DN675_c0_g1_i1:111-2636(+)